MALREFTSTPVHRRRHRDPRPRVRRGRVQRAAAAGADHPARRVRPGAVPALTDRRCSAACWRMRYDDLLASVGNTPLVGLPTCRRAPTYASGPSSRTATPPARSRTAPALWMIERRREGRAGCGPAARSSSRRRGNTGISLAMAAKLKGYRLVCVMPENTSEERRQLLRMWGAEIISSPAAGGSNEAVRRGQGDRRRAPRLGDALPVRQPGQRPRPLRGHRPRAARRPAGDHPLRRRPRHHRHADGRRPLLPRAQAGGADRRRRAAVRRAGLRPAQPRRGLRPRAVRRRR